MISFDDKLKLVDSCLEERFIVLKELEMHILRMMDGIDLRGGRG